MSTVKTRQILLIEPELTIREVAQLCLETIAGWKVLTAGSAREGLLTAESEVIDAILLDFDAMLDELDWPATVQQLKTNPVTRHIPVVLLTPITQPEELLQVCHREVTVAIVKPFNLLTLASQVAAALHWNS